MKKVTKRQALIETGTIFEYLLENPGMSWDTAVKKLNMKHKDSFPLCSYSKICETCTIKKPKSSLCTPYYSKIALRYIKNDVERAATIKYAIGDLFKRLMREYGKNKPTERTLKTKIK